MQKVRGAVIAHRVQATLLDHLGLHAIADAQVALVDAAVVNDQPLEGTPRILHAKSAHRSGNIAPVADLSAALGVEGGRVEQEERLLRRADTLDLRAIHNHANYLAAAPDAIVADKARGTEALEQRGKRLVILRLDERTCRAAALLLALHRLLEAGGIDREALLPRDLLGQFHREAVRIVKFEDLFAGNHHLLPLLQAREQLIQQRESSVEGLAKLLLLNAQHLDDAVALRTQFGVVIAHQGNDGICGSR